MNNEDAKQLDLLAVFHYVVGGIMALLACLPFIHVLMGLAIALGKFSNTSHGSAQPPSFLGWFMVIMGSLFILFGWTLAICMIVAGRKLQQRKSRMYCMVIAGIECMFMPFGTVLGVFTLIALNKDNIKEAYAPPAPEIPID